MFVWLCYNIINNVIIYINNNQDVGIGEGDDDDYIDYNELMNNNNNTTTTNNNNAVSNYNYSSNNNNNNNNTYDNAYSATTANTANNTTNTTPTPTSPPLPLACEVFSVLLVPSSVTPLAAGGGNTCPPTTHALCARAAVLLGG